MGDREVKQPPAGHFWKQKTDVPDHAKQEGNYWVGPPREHSVRFPGLTLVVAFQRPRCCMEQRVTHWEVLTGTVGSEAQVGPHGRASLPSITSASTSGSLYTPSARYAWSMFSMTAETCRRRQPSRSCPTSAARWPVVRTAAPRIARPRSRGGSRETSGAQTARRPATRGLRRRPVATSRHRCRSSLSSTFFCLEGYVSRAGRFGRKSPAASRRALCCNRFMASP